MGEMSKSSERYKGALQTMSIELMSGMININILVLSIVQYLCSFKYRDIEFGNTLTPNANTLSNFGPVKLRLKSCSLVRSRNIVAHALNTQLYRSKVTKYTSDFVTIAEYIIDFEAKLRMANKGEQQRMIDEFWGYHRSLSEHLL